MLARTRRRWLNPSLKSRRIHARVEKRAEQREKKKALILHMRNSMVLFFLPFTFTLALLDAAAVIAALPKIKNGKNFEIKFSFLKSSLVCLHACSSLSNPSTHNFHSTNIEQIDPRRVHRICSCWAL